MSTSSGDARRRIPRTDTVLADPRIAATQDRLGPMAVKQAVHEAQQQARSGLVAPEDVVETALSALPQLASSLRPVLNATGVIVHTNLGRAALSTAAVEALAAAAGYVDVEFDTQTGKRAGRGRGTLNALRAAVPGAGDALVVNNGAAALVLAATALAAGQEIIVSRGELVEIGDGFRIPDLIASTGARLREVGTTNRTHLADYRAAIGPDTGMVLKVHPSNFTVAGFTSAVPVGALAELGVPVVADIGSGLLHPEPALPDEPDAATWLAQGATLVTASGDKLLGGPQAGIVLGDAEVVYRLRRHPLARALRVDKLTLAALEATLTGPRPPTMAALHRDPAWLHSRAEKLAQALRDNGVAARTVPSSGVSGGGGAPGVTLPGWAIALAPEFAPALRTGDPCVVGRIEHDQCLLDLRCVEVEDDARLAEAVLAAHAQLGGAPGSCT